MFENFPTKKYEIVLADPPWSYTGQQDKWGAASKFYDTLSEQEIGELPIHDILSPRALVFLWATCPKLNIAISILDEWNLHYRGVAFVWVKTTLQGKPIGAQGVRPSVVKPLTEMVLVGSNVDKGRPLMLSDESIVQTIFAPKQEHSQKPNEVQDRIEKMYPAYDKLELFARRKRPGWDAWGDQI